MNKKETPYLKIPENWECESLLYFCPEKGIQTGPFGSQLHQSDYVSDGTPILTVEHLEENKISHNNLPQVSDSDLERLSKFKLEEGDIVFSRVGSVDRRAIVSKKEQGWLFSGRCLRVRTNKTKIIPAYLSYFFGLPSFKEYMRKSAVGATMPSLNTKILSEIPVIVPPFEIQRKIAAILSAYDDLIENNTRRIQILEEMAQRIYREWFVHFRFPGHENVKMVDSELGRIPEGWEVKELGEKITFKRGKNITKNEIAPGGIPVIAAGINPAYYHNQANVKAPIVTISASGANAGYIKLHLEDIWASDCSYFNKDGINSVFYYYSLVKFRQTEITGLQRGSAQPHVYAKDLMRLVIIDVHDNMIKKFEDIAEPIFGEIRVLKRKNINLRQTRDLLLPKLISGKIDVSDLDIDIVNLGE